MKNFVIVILGFFIAGAALAQSCGSIQNKDRRTFCYARTKGNPGMCGGIQNRDFRNYCYAILKGNKSMCGGIQNRDFRNECYSNF